MKWFKTILILSLPLLLCCCLHDNGGSCPSDRSHLLLFNYPDFQSRISCVNLGVFDSLGVCVESRCVEKEELMSLQGIGLSLAEGDYTVVCWGNVLENTALSGFSVGCCFEEVEVCHPNLNTDLPIPTTDPLYYGTQTFTVDYSAVQPDTVFFRPAHIGLDIHVRGIDAPQLREATSFPLIGISHTRTSFGYAMQCLGKFADYYPPVVFEPINKIAHTSLNVLRFSEADDLEVVLYDTHTGKSRFSVSLSSFVRKHGIEITEDNEVLVPIYIEIVNTTVRVTVEPWKETPVDQS